MNKHLKGFLLLLVCWLLVGTAISIVLGAVDPELERFGSLLGIILGIFAWYKIAKTAQ